MPEAAKRRVRQRATAPARTLPAVRPWTAALPGLPAALWALSGGVCGALTVPPFEQSWLAWVAIVPLLVALAGEPPAAAATCGVLMGLIMFTAIGYGTYAYDPSACIVVIGGLTVLLGAVFGIATALERATARPWLRPLLLPSLWVLSERISTAANVPWSAALSQTAHLTLVQSAAVLSAAWISLLLVLVNRALALAVEPLIHRDAEDPARRAASRWAAAFATLAVTATLAYGDWTLAQWTPASRTVQVAAIQPLIQTHEYRYEGMVPDYRARNTAAVDGLTRQALQQRVELLVWPEGGDGLFNLRVPARRERLSRLARDSGAALLISSYDLDRDGRLFNSVFSIDPEGKLSGRYDKVALTPMGEREFTAGARWSPLPTPFGPVGALICFESVFSAPARRLVAQGAVLLLISTSDATFRNSSIAALHARSAVYRALENRRAVIQAANTGPSMLIAATGEVQAQTPFFSRALLEGRVELRDDRSPYARLGDAPILALCFAAIVLATADGRVRRRRATAEVRTRPGQPVATWALGTLAATALMLGGALAALSLRLTSAGVAALPTWRDAVANFVQAPVVPLASHTAGSYRQRQPNTCGPAALAFLANYLGVETDEAAVVRQVTLTPDGTSLADLAGAARALGFDAWGERQNLAALGEVPKPVIAHIRDDHYVVVLALGADGVDVFDPSAGYARIPLGEFQRLWKGNILVVRHRELLH